MRDWGERLPLFGPADERSLATELEPGGRLATFEPSGTLCVCDEHGRRLGWIEYDGTSGGAGPRDRRVQFGILLGGPDCWGRGYGTEATVLLLYVLFNHRGVHRAWPTVQANNARAIRVYEKVNFVREGTYGAHNFYDGAWHDEHLYGLLAGECSARYRPAESGWEVAGRPRP